MSNRISLSAAAEQTGSFMRREGSLVLPVAFATFGIAFILLSLVMPDPKNETDVEGGLWALAAFPLLFLIMIGQITIAYLVLRPGVSVRDALGAAMKRLPTMIGVVLLILLGLVGLALLLSVVTVMIGVSVGAAMETTTAFVSVIVIAAMAWLSTRLLMLWPLLADKRGGVIESIKQAFRLSKPYFWKFFVVVIVSTIVVSLALGAVQLGIGSVLLIFGRLVGAEGAAALLTIILVALLSAAIQAFVAVLLANIYRQLTAPVGQTRP